MQWSEDRDKIAAALVQAQAVISSAEKTSTNPSLRNQYADLDAVWTAIRGPLGAAELAVIQAPSIEVIEGARFAVVVSEIVHSSGQWCRHTCRLPVPGGNRGVNDAQAAGVAVTYARRYSLLALLGVAGEDSDGHVSRHDPVLESRSEALLCCVARQARRLIRGPSRPPRGERAHPPLRDDARRAGATMAVAARSRASHDPEGGPECLIATDRPPPWRKPRKPRSTSARRSRPQGVAAPTLEYGARCSSRGVTR